MRESALQFGMPFEEVMAFWEINTLSVSFEATVVEERVSQLTVQRVDNL